MDSSVISEAAEDWATGISDLLRRLVAHGATEETCESFIQARKLGDANFARRILDMPHLPTSKKEASDLGADLDGVLEQLRVAALKPVVNSLDGRALQRYVQYVWHISEGIVRTHVDEPFWSHKRAVTAIVEIIVNSSLEQQDSVVKAPAP